jgi:adenylosuccinate lyase
VTDNAEILLMRDALNLLLPKLAKVISNLAKFAMEWKAMPTLAYTHLQAGIAIPESFLWTWKHHADHSCSAIDYGYIAKSRLFLWFREFSDHSVVGKRAAQWAQDLVFDLESMEHARDGLLLRGRFSDPVINFKN